MNSQVASSADTSTEEELSALAEASLADESAHDTPTLVPPSSDDPPPTARWTPPPALIASSRPGPADSSAPSWSASVPEWRRR